ncbi:MAG: hypothetical protein AB7O53_19440 [Thermoleophilia bacterium]
MPDEPTDNSGIDLMRRRIERASRRPPPAPRARRAEEPAVAVAPREEPTPVAAVGEGGGPAPTRSAAPRRRRTPAAPERPRLAPDLPPVNLAIRVRKPLDDHLADVIHSLRRDGVRTSKVELIEMLLWEQTSEDAEALRGRLAAFRAAAPRGAGAAL